MRILGLGKKKAGRPKTRKRMTRAEKRKDWAEERLMARAKIDPSAEAAMILKETGINIPPIDETRQEEKKLDEKITRMAFEEIESDETLKKRATQMKVEKILGGDPRAGEDEGEYYPFEGERGPLDTIREYRELEREFGSGTGAFSFLKDPAFLTQLLTTFGNIFPGAAGATAIGVGSGEGRTMVVEVDGHLIEMSPEAYQAYKAQREQLRLAQTRLKQVPGETPGVETEGQSEDKPETAESLTVESDDEEAGIAPTVVDRESDTGPATDGEVKPAEVDIEEFLPFAEEIAKAMEDTPQQFAEDLAASAKGGNQDARMLFLFLSTVTYDSLTESVKPYEQTEGLLQYIKKLSDNKEWVEEALAGIRRLVIYYCSVKPV